jgi:hypothetical protein
LISETQRLGRQRCASRCGVDFSPIQSDWVAYFSAVATDRSFNRHQHKRTDERDHRRDAQVVS